MSATTTQNRIAATILQGQEVVTCGECSGLEYDKLLGKQKSGCATEHGKTKDCTACSRFAPDVRQMENFIGSNGFSGMTNLIASIDGKSLRVLSALIRSEATTRKHGFAFGQKVYVRYRGRANADYMSNFMSAYVLFVNKHYMRLVGKDARCVLTYTRDAMPTLYTPESFEPLRRQMEAKGRRVDPDIHTTTVKRLRHIEEIELDMTDDSKAGNVTTIDTVFRESGGKRTKSEVYDLTKVVADLMQGYDVKGGKARTRKVEGSKKKATTKTKEKKTRSLEMSRKGNRTAMTV